MYARKKSGAEAVALQACVHCLGPSVATSGSAFINEIGGDLKTVEALHHGTFADDGA